MLRKTHMRDQTGSHKIDDIMRYPREGQMEKELVRLMVVGTFLLFWFH